MRLQCGHDAFHYISAIKYEIIYNIRTSMAYKHEKEIKEISYKELRTIFKLIFSYSYTTSMSSHSVMRH